MKLNVRKVEMDLAKELQRQKVEKERNQKEIERICAESEELKELKERIRTAYVNKERAAQLADNQLRRQQEMSDDAEIEARILLARKEQAEREKEQEQSKAWVGVEHKQKLLEQIQERERLKEEAYAEYLREKAAVDEAMKKMMEQDRKAAEEEDRKRQVFHDFMVKSVQAKQQARAREREEEILMDEKIKRYREEAAQREALLKMKKAEENAAKEQIFAKLNEEELRRRADKEYLENLRIELMQEEAAEAARIKELEEAKRQEK
eukprot:TRINITY_DN4135_c0_g2_i1.p1 TRINITY_DN4135_c0_g2~~TRINITY_DN4135_c0_g2_i1.p1  ORF type:complete len:265 (-),score=152.89 TRINITY_DN4135_c0_g2_i1:603-1397(-)